MELEDETQALSSLSSSQQLPSTGPSSSNKQRIALACQPCRSLKRKCTGGVPCSQCQRAGRTAADCIYSTGKVGARRNKTDPQGGYKDASLQRGTISPHYFSSLAQETDLADLWQGPSSALSFFDLCQAAILGPEVWLPKISNGTKAQGEPLTPMNEEALFVIPPDADELFEKFISVALPGQAVFHEPTLRADIATLLANAKLGVRPRALQLALYNALWAIATVLFADELDSADGHTSHETFHARMRNLLYLEKQTIGEHVPSMTLVQCLLWEAIYLDCQRAGLERGEMHSLEVASHYCISLGLHQEPSPAKFDPITAESRRRLYWCIRNVATLKGCIVGNVPFANAVPHTVALPADWPEQPGSPATLMCRHSSELALIGGKILDQLYQGATMSHKPTRELQIVLDLEEELQNWKESLPRHFQIDGIGSLGPLQQLLRLRYCYGRLMIMRPSLTRLLTSSPHQKGNDGRLDSITWQGAESLALEAAIEIIDAAALCSENRIYRRNYLLNTDFVFLATTVLLAARWHEPYPSFDHYWSKALDILRAHLPHVPQAADRLQGLAEQLESRTAMHQPPAPDLLGSLLEQIWSHDSTALPSVHRAQTW